jgi:hypothetical protein
VNKEVRFLTLPTILGAAAALCFETLGEAFWLARCATSPGKVHSLEPPAIGARQVRKTPGCTVCVLTLALGTGANKAVHGKPLAILPVVRKLLPQMDPNLPLIEPITQRAQYDGTTSQQLLFVRRGAQHWQVIWMVLRDSLLLLLSAL